MTTTKGLLSEHQKRRKAYLAIARYAATTLERKDLSETEAIVAILHYAIDTLMELEEALAARET